MSLDQMIRIAETAMPGPAGPAAPQSPTGRTSRAPVETAEGATKPMGGTIFYRDLGLERSLGTRSHPLREILRLEVVGRMALGSGIGG